MMNNNDNTKKVDDIANTLLYEILFAEKKNSNTNELKDSEMIKQIKKSIEREISKNEIQTNEAE